MRHRPPINARFASTARRPDFSLLCVESCVGGARIIGDIRDPQSRISQLIRTHHDAINVLKPENDTVPHVFYLGLDEAFVTPLMGRAQPALWQEV